MSPVQKIQISTINRQVLKKIKFNVSVSHYSKFPFGILEKILTLNEKAIRYDDGDHIFKQIRRRSFLYFL